MYYFIIKLLIMTSVCGTQLLISILPTENYIQDTVDRVEVNHIYDTKLQLVFVQVIFWDWNLEKERWEVVDWRIDKRGIREYTKEEIILLKEKYIKKYEEYYTSLALKQKKESLTRQGIIFTINEEKFKKWYLDNNPITIPPFDSRYYIPSDMARPINNKLIFSDPNQDCMREVKFTTFGHTHTQYDPELQNRDILTQVSRRGLTKKQEKFQLGTR